MQGKIYPDNFEKTIHFEKIRELLFSYCKSEIGKEKVTQMYFNTYYFKLQKDLFQVDEFRKIRIENLKFPSLKFTDEREILLSLDNGRNLYLPEQLLRLKHAIESVFTVSVFFEEKNRSLFPNLFELIKTVKLYPFVKEKIIRIITDKGRIKDNASKTLNQIRKQLSEKEKLVSKKIHQKYDRIKKEKWEVENLGVSVRNGRLVIPIGATHKRKLQGIVHDESASGKTAFVEPIEIVELNNEIHELEYKEKKEIENILYKFSEAIRPYAKDLINYYELLGKFDFINAKARLAIVLNAILPELKNIPFFNWKKAVHPLLKISYDRQKKSVISQNFYLNNDQRIMLISGPNAGGKSVCLQMIGLLQYMLQCGLLVPVDEGSVFGMIKRIFIDMGDEQNIEDDLSTYSSHLKNMKYYLKNSDENSLILIDEFGVGTEPKLGGAIAEEILKKLNQNKTYGIVTTHYGNLKYLASKEEGIVNAAMLFDTEKMVPLFKLEVGKPGSSFAFEVAHKIGLPHDLIKKAQTEVGEENVKFDKYLREISRDKLYIEKKRREIRRKEKSLEKMSETYESALNEFEKKRNRLIEEAKAKASLMMKEANKTIENTIRKIKEVQAHKDKTRNIRKKYEQVKNNIEVEKPDPLEKLKKIKFPSHIKMKPKTKTSNKKYSSRISTGDYAIVDEFEKKVKVLKISGNEAVVSFGNMTMNVLLKNLNKAHFDPEENEIVRNYENISSIQSQVHNKRLEFKSDLDVRGLNAEGAIQQVMNHLDDALMLNIEEVRILHGTGHGILRKAIRDYLMQRNDVVRFEDADVRFGGSGITIVSL